jgi:hypothetical protein
MNMLVKNNIYLSLCLTVVDVQEVLLIGLLFHFRVAFLWCRSLKGVY